MMKPEITARLHALSLYTRRLMTTTSSGMARTHRRGFGFEFDTLDDYRDGDDIRYIDHRRSAQRDKLIVRRYLDEPSRTIMIMVDASASALYGSHDELVTTLQGEIATVLTLAGSYHQDAVGGMLFAEDIISYTPPMRGVAHAMQLAQHFLTHQPQGTTSWLTAAKYVMSRLRQRALIIMISDGFDNYYQDALRMLYHRHDVVMVRVVDHYTAAMPPIDMIACQDNELGTELDPFSYAELQRGEEIVRQWHEQQETFCACHGIDCCTIVTGQPWVAPVIHFFERRKQII